MEEEKKVGCCENKDGVACGHGMAHCCHNWKKCHMIKRIIMIVVIIVAFCLGSQWGEMKGEYRNNRFERGGMMNWGYGQFEGKGNNFKAQTATDEVTVKVEGAQAPAATVTPKQ